MVTERNVCGHNSVSSILNCRMMNYGCRCITKTKMSGLRLFKRISAGIQCNSIEGSASHWYGWNKERKALTGLPPALRKSNYCDNIHGNQAKGAKSEGREEQIYHLFGSIL